MHQSHRWEDVSFHGSPYYECELCGCKKSDRAANLPCPELGETLTREAAAKILEQNTKYSRYLRELQEFKDLHQKYGNGPFEDLFK